MCKIGSTIQFDNTDHSKLAIDLFFRASPFPLPFTFHFTLPTPFSSSLAKTVFYVVSLLYCTTHRMNHRHICLSFIFKSKFGQRISGYRIRHCVLVVPTVRTDHLSIIYPSSIATKNSYARQLECARIPLHASFVLGFFKRRGKCKACEVLSLHDYLRRSPHRNETKYYLSPTRSSRHEATKKGCVSSHGKSGSPPSRKVERAPTLTQLSDHFFS
jgi:hypothetical protein